VKHYRCFVCNEQVPKAESAPLYNTTTARNFCKSHVDDYQDDHKYIWDEKEGKLARGYTRSEIDEMKMAGMTPEEKRRYEARSKRTGEAVMASLFAMMRPPQANFFDPPKRKEIHWPTEND